MKWIVYIFGSIILHLALGEGETERWRCLFNWSTALAGKLFDTHPWTTYFHHSAILVSKWDYWLCCHGCILFFSVEILLVLLDTLQLYFGLELSKVGFWVLSQFTELTIFLFSSLGCNISIFPCHAFDNRPILKHFFLFLFSDFPFIVLYKVIHFPLHFLVNGRVSDGFSDSLDCRVFRIDIL